MEFNYLASGSLHDLIGSLGVGHNFMERSLLTREKMFFFLLLISSWIFVMYSTGLPQLHSLWNAPSIMSIEAWES